MVGSSFYLRASERRVNEREAIEAETFMPRVRCGYPPCEREEKGWVRYVHILLRVLKTHNRSVLFIGHIHIIHVSTTFLSCVLFVVSVFSRC